MVLDEGISTRLFRRAAGVEEDSVISSPGVEGLHVLLMSESEHIPPHACTEESVKKVFEKHN